MPKSRGIAMTGNPRHMLLGALLFTNSAAGVILAQQVPLPGSSFSPSQAPRLSGTKIRPSEFPPGVPRVTCKNDQLTISADNATLRSIFSALETCLALKIEIPSTLRDERSFIQLGPGPVREVLQDLLGSTDLDYALQPSDRDPTRISALLLMPHLSDVPAAKASNDATVPGSASMSAARRAWIEARDASGRGASPIREDTSESSNAESAPSPDAISSTHDSISVVVAKSGIDTEAAAEPRTPSQQTAAKGDTTAAPGTAQGPVTDPSVATPTTQQADPASAVTADPAVNASAMSAAPPADRNNHNPEGNDLQKKIIDMQQLFEDRKKLNSNGAPATSGTPAPADPPQ